MSACRNGCLQTARDRARSRILLGLCLSLFAAAIAADERAVSAGEAAPPPELRVAADGSAEYSTIKAALDAATEGATIRVAAGTYEEPVKITKSVTLIGAGWEQTLITLRSFDFRQMSDGTQVAPAERARLRELVERYKNLKDGKDQNEILRIIYDEFAWKRPLIIQNVRGVKISGLRLTLTGTVTAGGWQKSPAIQLENAGVELTNCAVAGSAGEGVDISGDSDVLVRDSLLAGIRSTGIQVQSTPSARVRIVDCEIRNCGYSGVTIKGEGQVDVDGCRISGTEYHGVRYDDASPSVAGNVFMNINRAGIYADGESHATIRDNVFIGCAYGGSRGHDLIDHNTFVFRQRAEGAQWPDHAAIWIDATPHPIVRRNVFAGFDHAVGVTSGKVDARLVDHNVFEVKKAAIVRRPVLGPSPIEDEVTPPENESRTITFANAEQHDFRLPDSQEWRDLDVGARRFTPVASPWPELSEERRLMDAVVQAEAKKK